MPATNFTIGVQGQNREMGVRSRQGDGSFACQRAKQQAKEPSPCLLKNRPLACYLKQLPPMNSLRMEFRGTWSDCAGRK